jgi:His-Xaa-Ser system radical SAM maturase HxsC
MLALHTHGKVTGGFPRHPVKVLGLQEALRGPVPADRVVVHLPADGPDVDVDALDRIGFAGLLLDVPPAGDVPLPVLTALADPAVVQPGDAIRVRPETGQVSILFRRGANANSLFVTERCNSRCLMCSQPPRDEDDTGRIGEILDLLPLIDPDLDQLGITGGEPTLLGEHLPRLIRACKAALPDTKLHILTNGRNFADPGLADAVSDAVGHSVWAIPLYADVASRHDCVVQTAGAFEESVNGIYNLAERGHAIEIRFVVSAQTLPRMERFAEFVYRNMPFVSHVAFMGLEPMGFAKVNRDLLWIDPLDFAGPLTRAAQHLHDRGMMASIYNIPLCVLPRPAWPLARQSISDWKNTYDPACERCSVRTSCCGFFASYGPAWRSRGIRAIAFEETA